VVEGTIIAGRYAVQRLIGQGSMGAVWLALDGRENRPVAIKLIDAALARDESARRRFLREAEIVARSAGPHVVQMFEQGVAEDGRPYFVMEFLAGISLRERLEDDGSLSVPDTARLLSEVCAALEPPHGAGLVHRDLKPEHIFLVPEGEHEVVKLLDFGVAKAALLPESALYTSTSTGDLIGTPLYMSPEQVQGVTSVDFRTDLWALGVIVFECLTGVRPFEAKALPRLVARILAGPLPVPSQLAPEAALTPEIDAWMARALARDPAARFASARELATEFARAAAEDAPAPRDASPIRRALDAGDVSGAVQTALTQFGPEILRYLANLLEEPGLADDAFSLFCERVWFGLPRFEWRCSFRTWAFVVARRAAADVRRVEGRQRRLAGPVTDSQLSRIAEQVRTATLPLLKTEGRSAFRRLRDELPHDDKMLLVLRIDRGLAWEELARVFLDAPSPDATELRREAARLRKRFQLVKERLRERAKAAGMLEEP
jgi:serine/threonine-protein kinase